jgi:hypothetical protein
MKTYVTNVDGSPGVLSNTLRDICIAVGKKNISNIYTTKLMLGKYLIWVVLKYHRDFVILSLTYGASKKVPVPTGHIRKQYIKPLDDIKIN